MGMFMKPMPETIEWSPALISRLEVQGSCLRTRLYGHEVIIRFDFFHLCFRVTIIVPVEYDGLRRLQLEEPFETVQSAQDAAEQWLREHVCDD